MIPEKLEVIPECDVTPAIPDNSSLPVIQKTVSLITETSSANLVPENGSPNVISGKTESRNNHVRRYSTGNISIPYKGIKIPSRYLGASTSSCHDNCKYGTRHDPEPKTPNSPVFGKRMDKQGYKGLDIGKTLAERKMKLAGTIMTSPHAKSPRPDFHVPTKSEVSSPWKKETVLLKQRSLPLKGVVSKSKPVLSKQPVKVYSRDREDGDELYRNKELRKLESIKEMKNSVSDQEKAVSKATVSLSSLRAVKKVLTRPIASLSPKRSKKKASSTETSKSLKVVSHYKDRSCEDVPEKTLHVIESSQSLSSLESKSLRRIREVTGAIQSPKYHDKEKNPVNAKVDLRNSPSKGGDIGTKVKGSSVETLSFRKGKVLELNPVISSPRRLKFRRRLSDSQIDIVEKLETKLKRTEIHADDDLVSVTKSEPEKVVLKHQEIEEKKFAQTLLNNVIEKTANKLAETRKSKVKALVGAFETVISLQDTKPSSTADSCSSP